MQEFLVTAVDIGTQKISASSGISRLGEEVEILGSSCVYSKGIDRGKIVDSKACKESFLEVLYKLEEEINEKIYDIYIGLPSSDLKLKEYEIKVTNTHNNFLKNLKESILNLQESIELSEDERICDVSINYYKIGDDVKLEIPKDVLGDIYVNVTVFLCNRDTLNKYKTICIDTRYNIKGFISNINSLRNIFLFKEELGEKAIVDSGAGLTEIGIFKDGVIKELISIPLGGNNITSDLSICAGLTNKEAELVKCEYSNNYVSILNDDLQKEILIDGKSIHKELYFKVCEARIEEILNYVNNELKNTSHYNDLCSIILCSDSLTNFENIKALVSEMIDYKVNIITKSDFNMQNLSNITSLAIVKEVHDRVELICEDFTKDVKGNTLKFEEISDIDVNANYEIEDLGHDDKKKKNTGIIGKIRSLLEDIF
ncbi:cell division FtsA domain-containing protein [Clostridium sp.]|uniref:cell division FtsA domain-containing protein n=1 Tax=Clostridium sp. TaxID=1506 RepID=UPI0026DCD0FE|nr:cell division FtsA domain-containing protein [Clostridium sp.]MDO5038126.1 cell division FtsA domain-containing protein [Clostridium sp.]